VGSGALFLWRGTQPPLAQATPWQIAERFELIQAGSAGAYCEELRADKKQILAQDDNKKGKGRNKSSARVWEYQLE
jgi:hypothetical protein